MEILFVVLAPIDGNTSGIISNIGIINGLTELGHNVSICTTMFYGDNVKEIKNYFKHDVKIYRINRNKLYKAAVNVRKKQNLIKKFYSISRKLYYKFKIIDNFKPVAKSISLNELEEFWGLKYFDVVISASDPKSSHLAVKNLIKQGLKYGKWIEYWGDPLAADITRHNIWPKACLKFVETKLIKDCDKIFYVSPFTKELQQSLYKKYASKMEFEPLPYNEAKIYPISDLSDEKVSLGYFGDYSSNVRNIMPLYNLAKKNKDILLEIAGNSDLKLETYSNINIYQRLKKEEIEKKEEKVDILVCILNTKGTQIPGKLYYSASTNKPILVILDGDEQEKMENYLTSFNRFEICKNKENDIKKAINKICNENKMYKPSEYFEPSKIAKNILQKTFGDASND